MILLICRWPSSMANAVLYIFKIIKNIWSKIVHNIRVRKIEQLKKKSLMNLNISSMYLFWAFNARLMQLIKLRPIFFLLFPPFPKNMSRTYVNSNASRYYIKQKMLRGKKTKNVISEVSSTTNDLLLPPITQGYYVLMRYYIRTN